jgi:hypothetical protein
MLQHIYARVMKWLARGDFSVTRTPRTARARCRAPRRSPLATAGMQRGTLLTVRERDVRQYVLAFPYELSGLAATRPEGVHFNPHLPQTVLRTIRLQRTTLPLTTSEKR